jgi:hypothetical protein
MKTSRKFTLALITGAAPILVVAVGLIVNWRMHAGLPDEIESILEEAETFELLSIDPELVALKEKPADAEAFHGYHVLGSTKITDKKTQHNLIAAVDRSMAKSLGSGFKCFFPRHGIRAIHNGQTVDLLLCFQCGNMEIHLNDNRLPTEYIARGEQSVFDDVLTQANITLAPRDD